MLKELEFTSIPVYDIKADIFSGYSRYRKTAQTPGVVSDQAQQHLV